MSTQFADFASLPAPSGGIDAVSNLSQMQPTEALYAYNVIMTQGGPTVRPGWQEWAKNMSITGGGVRTIIAVRGAGSAGAQDFLFCVTSQGIWNVTTSQVNPTLVVTFGVTTGFAGYAEWDHFTNLNGDVNLLVCDEANGYYTFDTATSTWTKVSMGSGTTQIAGADPTQFASVRVFNNRVWFVQTGTGNSWYLPVAQIYGTVTQFDWGNRFSHGGNLNNLYIFTYGSYLGTYVYLVAIGDAGDVLAYTGSDPSQAATWTLSGQWYVGDLPVGRRTASNYGGDLNIICAYGVLQLSSLFFQKDSEDPSLYLTKKIAPAIASDIQLYGAYRGFGFVSWPSQNSLILTEPVIYNSTTGAPTYTRQYCYNLATNAWTVFQGLNWQHAAYWHGNLYAGTSDGRVIKMTGNADGVSITGTNGMAINFGILGAFVQGRGGATNSIVDLITAYFSTDSPVSYQTFVRYDFDVTDLSLGSVAYTAPALTGGWDSGVWDSAIWSGGGAPIPQFSNYGATPGMGKWMCIGCVGATMGATKLIGYGVSSRSMAGFL